jgi:hypothetical protein
MVLSKDNIKKIFPQKEILIWPKYKKTRKMSQSNKFKAKGMNQESKPQPRQT